MIGSAGRGCEKDNGIPVPVAQLDRVSDSDIAGRGREKDNRIRVPVAQLDRVSDSDSEGRRFESFRARQKLNMSAPLDTESRSG